jgi:hypothetical protein
LPSSRRRGPEVASDGTCTFTEVGVTESGTTPVWPTKSTLVVDPRPCPLIFT